MMVLFVLNYFIPLPTRRIVGNLRRTDERIATEWTNYMSVESSGRASYPIRTLSSKTDMHISSS